MTTKEHPATEKQQNNAARPCGAEWNFNKKKNLKFKKGKKKLNFGKTGLHTHVDNKNHKFIWKQEKNEKVTFFFVSLRVQNSLCFKRSKLYILNS